MNYSVGSFLVYKNWIQILIKKVSTHIVAVKGIIKPCNLWVMLQTIMENPPSITWNTLAFCYANKAEAFFAERSPLFASKPPSRTGHMVLMNKLDIREGGWGLGDGCTGGNVTSVHPSELCE